MAAILGGIAEALYRPSLTRRRRRKPARRDQKSIQRPFFSQSP